MGNRSIIVAVRLPLCVVGLSFACAAPTATTSTIDITAGVGASSNPLLQLGGDSSAFGRISVLGTHEWRTERTISAVSLFAENTTYLSGGYGSKQIFDLSARTLHQVNPNLSIYGNIGFQGDFGGQLSNRFATATPEYDLPTIDLPPSAILDDPSYIGFGGRQYRLSGQAGLSVRTSARSSVSASVGAQRNFATGSLSDGDFTSYFGSLSYDTRLNERTSVGIGSSVQYQDYDSGGSSTVFNPFVSARHQFSEQVVGSASAGLIVARQRGANGGSSNSLNPSFSFSLCKNGERDRLCARAAREARNSFGYGSLFNTGTLTITTSAGIDYSRQLDANQSIQFALSANRYSSKLSGGNDAHSTYAAFLAGYDRKISERFAAGVNGGVRKLMLSGRDPKADISGNLYLRYRLGDMK